LIALVDSIKPLFECEDIAALWFGGCAQILAAYFQHF